MGYELLKVLNFLIMHILAAYVDYMHRVARVAIERYISGK